MARREEQRGGLLGGDRAGPKPLDEVLRRSGEEGELPELGGGGAGRVAASSVRSKEEDVRWLASIVR
jgi:hypothetical protein